jgi:hypothetical protein
MTPQPAYVNLEPLPDDPDEATIAARCAEIQARWTEAERMSREGLRPWTVVPVISLRAA